ncbi:MAG: type II secretion system protein GspJ [Chthoniobacteraceae bacterium]
MNRRAFTLIEIMMAMAGGAVILAAIYGIFTKAVHLRDDGMRRTREVRVRARAAATLRNDLHNAFVSGGKIAASLTGSVSGHSGNFPGYLKFTTTTTPDSGDLLAADVQEVEYYVTTDAAAEDSSSGQLVRTVDRDLLATVRQAPAEEPLLAGVKSMEVSFYDGSSWQQSWEVTENEKTLPEAVKVRILTTANAAPIEVLVPWTTQVSIE